VTKYAIRQSTYVGIEEDQIIGIAHLDVIKLFGEDPDTKAIIMMGGIGENLEEVAVAYLKQRVKNILPHSLLGQSLRRDGAWGMRGHSFW
jgi:succinyl-CoA synthetase alpha subunit